MIEAEVDVKGSKQVISTFDLRSGKIKKGRDGKVRSSSYVISCFSVDPHATEINVYTIDLISEKAERSRYSMHCICPKSFLVLHLSGICRHRRQASNKKQILFDYKQKTQCRCL